MCCVLGFFFYVGEDCVSTEDDVITLVKKKKKAVEHIYSHSFKNGQRAKCLIKSRVVCAARVIHTTHSQRFTFSHCCSMNAKMSPRSWTYAPAN